MFSKIRALRNILVTSAVIAGAPAYGTVEEFIELCSVSNLPEATLVTIDTLKKFVNGWEHEQLNCADLAAKLQTHKALDLPGMTFHYYTVSDLTPISLLDWIEELEISGQQPATLEPLQRMKNLRKLDISGFRGEQYVIASLTELTSLSISLDGPNNQIGLITPLSKLKNLSVHFVGGKYNLSVLPQSIESLSVSGAGLKSLRGIETLYLLNELHLQGLKMRSLRGIDGLPQKQIEKLTISGSEIGDFSALGHLENQSVLSITYSNLTDISFISKMTALKDVDLQFNKINNLSPLAEVRWIENLNLGSNQISSSSPLDNLTYLKTLYLNHNFLPFIRLGNWPRLEVLELTKNNIGHGPQLSMQPWQYQIKELGLSMNELRVLDSEVAKIQTIKTLGLMENRLANVEAISKLTNLEVLNVADNKIVDLSPLAALTSLKELTFYDNPLQTSGCPVTPATICTHP
jgi:internalin A